MYYYFVDTRESRRLKFQHWLKLIILYVVFVKNVPFSVYQQLYFYTFVYWIYSVNCVY